MILASSQISFRFIDVVVVDAGLKKNLMLLKKEGKFYPMFKR
jgi:hypothetical protein